MSAHSADIQRVTGTAAGTPRRARDRRRAPARPLATLGPMIDLRELRENPEPYRASQRARGGDVDLVDRVVEPPASEHASKEAA